MLPIAVQATTPTVSNVTGTIASGQTLTVTGANMVDENRTSWDPFFSASASGFEGTALSTDGYTSGEPTVTYDSTVKLMGAKSLKAHTSGAHTYPNYGSDGAYQFLPSASVSDLYFRAYSRWNVSGAWPDSDIKYWWLGGGETQFLNVEANGGAAPVQIAFYAPSVNGGNWLRGNIPSGAIENGRWYLIELHIRRHGAGSYVVEVWVDNQRVIYTTNATDGPSYNGWGWEANTNYWDTVSGFVSDHWQDGFAIASSRVGPASLIEIADSSDYATAQKVYQAPEYLSDGSLQVKADLTGLGAGPYYLFVTNNRQERSAAYLLGEADTTPPGAPSGLGVE